MLTFYAPLIAYILSFPIMIITIFRVDLGIFYFISLVPFIAVMKKIQLFPQGHNVPDFLLVSMILGCILTSKTGSLKSYSNSPINTVVKLVVLWSLINLLWSFSYNSFPLETNISLLKDWKNYMILPVLYFVATRNVDSEKKVKILILCICLSVFGMCFNFHSTFKWLKTYHYHHEIRTSGPFTFLGPNELGIFFSMTAFFLLGISYFIENRILKYFALFGSVSCLYPIVYSYSRSAYLCAIAGVFTIGFLKDRKLLILLCFCLLFYRVLLPNSVIERIDMTFLDKTYLTEETLDRRAVDIGGTTVDTVNRVGLWRKAFDYFKEQPLFGIGFGAFLEREGKITHSLFFQILAEQGLIGLCIFLFFTYVTLKQAFKLYKHSKSMLGRGIGLAFFTCSILHLVGSVGGNISTYYNLMCIYWLFLGVVARFNEEI